MKTSKTAKSLFSEIRDRILQLPPDERKRLSDELAGFLLFDAQSQSTASHDMKNARPSPSPGLTPGQIRLIQELGNHTRRLNDQMGDDLYFFM